ncbi:hypothetical protein Hanom_Chr10g00894351 [Helianthus anomalus]
MHRINLCIHIQLHVHIKLIAPCYNAINYNSQTKINKIYLAIVFLFDTLKIS